MQVNRNYSSPFVLDESKLRRIQSVFNEHFDADNGPFAWEFSAKLEDKKIIKFRDLDKVIGLDNSVKNPIISFTIAAKSNQPDDASDVSLEDEEKQHYRSQVRFTRPQWPEDSIELAVSSHDDKWTHSIGSALEEQIERTIQKNPVVRTKASDSPWTRVVPLIITAFAMFLIMALLLGNIGKLENRRFTNTFWLSDADLTFFKENPGDLSPQEVVTRQIRNIQLARAPEADGEGFHLWRLFAAIGPIVIVILALLYLFVKCYPAYVFDWGDMHGWYDSVVQRRKMLWVAVVFGSIIGVVTNFSVYGILSLTVK